jgi:RNA polymerase sigma-70 factor (ECF subfamily)
VQVGEVKADNLIIDTLIKDGDVDAALVQRMRGGDAFAFEQLYYRWNKQVYAFMLKTTRSVSDAEEITQEVFVRLWNMRGSIDPEKKIQSLIFTIARRIAVDMYRRSGKLKTALPDDAGEDRALSQGWSPQEILEEHETNLLMDIAVESMPPKQREVFSLYYHHSLSPKEIAARSGLSYDNVRKHIYNGKQQLREMISFMIACLIFIR